MKALARLYIWWPKMDDSIEDVAKRCPSCQQASSSPPKAPLHSWEWPSQPWSRLHLDFAGPFMGHMFLVMVDSYSKWLDVQIMQSITAEKTIEKLQSIFSTHGLPKQIVTDNGTSFTSEKFKQFFHQEWHQIHILCSIPSLHKWTGREGSPNIHTTAQRNVTRHSERKTDQILF